MKSAISSLLAVALAVTFSASASLPVAPDIPDTASKGPEGNVFPEDHEGDPFEIVVPVARNFSSLEELFQILREDSQEPRAVTGTPPTYVKGTERNTSDYLIFLTDIGNKGTR